MNILVCSPCFVILFIYYIYLFKNSLKLFQLIFQLFHQMS
nr:MAG TPA: protein of unknown function (DUF4512) [Bacteriophage sp.]